MRPLCLALALAALGTVPARAEDLPPFEIEFLPSADAAALQRFVRRDYAAEAAQPGYAGFTVTLEPGIAQLRLPAQFSGSLADLMVATGCLSGASPKGFGPTGVSFAPRAETGVECRRWTGQADPAANPSASPEKAP